MLLRMFVAAIGLGLLGACAAPAEKQNMTAGRSAVVMAETSPLKNAICVGTVTGGEETNPLWTSEVDNAAFAGALNDSLRNNSLLGPSAEECSYDLNANLLGLAQPIIGLDMTVTSNVNYSVIERANKSPYLQSTVQKPYTADFSSAFLGVKRLRLANEGAIKGNIATFIDQLLRHKPATAKPKATGKPTS